MEGLRINEMTDKIQSIKEQLLDANDMEQIKVVHEIIDDTPYKTKNYMKYMHDEYYIKHNKEHLIKNALKKIPLRVNEEKMKEVKLTTLIKNRYSLRDYENIPIDFESFSNIIHFSFGVKNYGLGAYNQKKYPFKYTNTQGGLNYLDMYIVVNNVVGLEQGLYYYDFMQDELCMLDYGNMRPLINEINFQNEFCVYSNFLLYIVADMERVVPKYYKRAYRFTHVDSGILAAYLQLLGEGHGIGSCSIAGYLEHKLENILELSSNDYPILSICFGFKPEEV